jgi:tetratricopeptide (TPR) repeat protein
MGRYEESIESFERFAELENHEVAHFYPVIDALVENEDYDRAKEYVRRAFQAWREDIHSTYIMADIIYATEGPEQAIKQYQEAIKLYA